MLREKLECKIVTVEAWVLLEILLVILTSLLRLLHFFVADLDDLHFCLDVHLVEFFHLVGVVSEVL